MDGLLLTDVIEPQHLQFYKRKFAGGRGEGGWLWCTWPGILPSPTYIHWTKHRNSTTNSMKSTSSVLLSNTLSFVHWMYVVK